MGKGLYGEVWRAHDPLLDREVAVKVFRTTDRAELAALDHARALARVKDHTHVVVVHDVAGVRDPEDPSSVVNGVVMELLDGETLADRLANGNLHRAEAERVGMGLLAGVRAIHDAGIVHADLHERNVLLDARVGAKVIDILSRGTLALASTATRDGHFGRDVVAVRELLGVILQHSDVEFAASYQYREATRTTQALDEVEAQFTLALRAEAEPPDEGQHDIWDPPSLQQLAASLVELALVVEGLVSVAMPTADWAADAREEALDTYCAIHDRLDSVDERIWAIASAFHDGPLEAALLAVGEELTRVRRTVQPADSYARGEPHNWGPAHLANEQLRHALRVTHLRIAQLEGGAPSQLDSELRHRVQATERR